MDDKKYGVKLSLDLTDFKKNVKEAKSEVKELEKPIETEIKTTSLDEAQKRMQKLQESITRIQNNLAQTQGIKGLDKMNAEFAKSLNDKKRELADLQKQLGMEDFGRKVKVTGDGEPYEITIDTSEAEEKLSKLEEDYKSVKQRIEDGDIKITGLDYESGADVRKREAEFSAWQQAQAGPIKTTTSDALSQELTELITKGEEASNVLDKTADSAEKVGNASSGIKNLNISMKSLSVVGNVASKALNKIQQGFRKGTANLKRFTMGLIGVQSAYRIVSRAMSAYMSYDQDLQKSFQQTWAGLGSLLAPILEWLIALFQKLLAYLNAVVKAFTGINMVARANAKAMNKVSASGAKANKTLASFDELNNINQDTGGGGADVPQIELPDVDTSGIDSWIEKIKKYITEGDWFGLGYEIADKLADAMEKIPWDKIKKKAGDIGKHLAEFINGAVANKRFWKDLGNTLAQGINTAIEFTYNYVETIDAQEIGDSLALSITTAIKNIDWGKFFQTLIDIVANIIDLFSGLLTGDNADWNGAQDAIVKGLFDIKSDKLLTALTNFVARLMPILTKVMTGIYLWELIDKYVLTPTINYCINKLTDGGKLSIEGLFNGMWEIMKDVGNWIYDHIFKPIWEGLKKAFGIASPSKKMKELGVYLVEGLIEGIKNLPDKVREVFQNMKSKVETKLTEIKTSAGNIAVNISNAISNGFNNLKSKLQNTFRSIMNGVISIINQASNKINGFLNISISAKTAKILNKLGVGVDSGSYQLFRIPTVPSLAIGTDEVRAEGLAYLHAGEQIVPADVVKGGYSGNGNEETNSLLRELIEIVDSKDYQPQITVDEIGQASVTFIRNQRRITGGSVI